MGGKEQAPWIRRGAYYYYYYYYEDYVQYCPFLQGIWPALVLFWIMKK